MSAEREQQLHDNVAVNLVEYVRSNTIRNEQQFLLLTFAYSSGLFDNTHHYISSVAIGTSSSGKSHLKDKVDALFEKLNVMEASTGSSKSLIYDDEWDYADVVSMGELQQPDEEMLEFLKRAHGGDEKVVIKTTRGNPNDGFETETIEKEAKSYHFTYAQFDADFEFWNRLLKVPVHESESKNRAVGRMTAGHEQIELEGDDYQYGYDYEEGTELLIDHFHDVKRHAPKHTVLPNGSLGYGWDVWSVMEPIFNHSRSESNRIYSMVFNLIRASALINYKNRETTTDSDGNEAIVVHPQDVANVVDCLDALRSTTHEIDRKKRAIVEAIRTKSGADDTIEGVEPIREFLRESDAPEVKRDELENILEDLEDNFLVDIIRGAGTNDKDVYTAFKWDELGRPRIDENADLFDDCVSPLTNEPFLESWAERRSEMETTAQDLLKKGKVESGPSIKTNDDGDAGLSNFGAGGNDEPELEDLESEILGRIGPVIDGTRIEDMSDVPIEGFLGLCSVNDPDLSGVNSEGTMLDPTHDVWDRPDKPDDWVTTETEARRQIKQTITSLISKDAIVFDTIHREENGSPVDATLAVGVDL